jgi:hypothetical protein
MFDSLKEDYHWCGMDKLYISKRRKRFSENSTTGRSSIMSGTVKGTTNAAALKRDEDFPNLIALSVHDTKPIPFLLMSCETIQWITKERYLRQVQGSTRSKNHLRLNINDNYNKEMGHVNVSDQLQNYYWFDHYMRQQKRWWSIAFKENLCSVY